MSANAKLVLITSATTAFLLLSSAECLAFPWKCAAVALPRPGTQQEIAIAASQTLARQEAIAACNKIRNSAQNCTIHWCRDMREPTKGIPHLG
jgi:hypothetical protein